MACGHTGIVIKLPTRAPIAGEVELVLIKYLGWIDEVNYIGGTTEAMYSFGLERQSGYVDRRDLDGFLDAKEDGYPVFELVNND